MILRRASLNFFLLWLILTLHQVVEAIEDADAEDESLTETRESQREKELSLFWQYIDNMLTNLGPQPIERIHQRLKIFAMQVSAVYF